MPYKVVGKNVYVKRKSRWVILKKHSTIEKAKKHLAALNINVHRKGTKKK